MRKAITALGGLALLAATGCVQAPGLSGAGGSAQAKQVTRDFDIRRSSMIGPDHVGKVSTGVGANNATVSKYTGLLGLARSVWTEVVTEDAAAGDVHTSTYWDGNGDGQLDAFVYETLGTAGLETLEAYRDGNRDTEITLQRATGVYAEDVRGMSNSGVAAARAQIQF